MTRMIHHRVYCIRFERVIVLSLRSVSKNDRAVVTTASEGRGTEKNKIRKNILRFGEQLFSASF